MRGLKPEVERAVIDAQMSHLLQMRGLKRWGNNEDTDRQGSHLLQMRGLKPLVWHRSRKRG